MWTWHLWASEPPPDTCHTRKMRPTVSRPCFVEFSALSSRCSSTWTHWKGSKTVRSPCVRINTQPGLQIRQEELSQCIHNPIWAHGPGKEGGERGTRPHTCILKVVRKVWASLTWHQISSWCGLYSLSFLLTAGLGNSQVTPDFLGILKTLETLDFFS